MCERALTAGCRKADRMSALIRALNPVNINRPPVAARPQAWAVEAPGADRCRSPADQQRKQQPALSGVPEMTSHLAEAPAGSGLKSVRA